MRLSTHMWTRGDMKQERGRTFAETYETTAAVNLFLFLLQILVWARPKEWMMRRLLLLCWFLLLRYFSHFLHNENLLSFLCKKGNWKRNGVFKDKKDESYSNTYIFLSSRSSGINSVSLRALGQSASRPLVFKGNERAIKKYYYYCYLRFPFGFAPDRLCTHINDSFIYFSGKIIAS